MTPQHPAAPEGETDASVRLTEAEHVALDEPWCRADGPALIAAVERIVAERLRVVEGERDDLMALAVEDTRRRGEATARAESAEAAHAALVALAEAATQRAYFQIAVEKCLTIEPLNTPGDGDPRARVPGHWRAEAEARAVVAVDDLRALLAGGGA